MTQARATASVEGREVLTVQRGAGHRRTHLAHPVGHDARRPRTRGLPTARCPGDYDNSIFNHVETRIALGRTLRRNRRHRRLTASPRSGSRVPGHLEPSAATLAIFGDFVAGGTTQPLGQSTMGRSLDNTIRIATLEPTEWVLVEIHMHALVGRIRSGHRLPLEPRRHTARAPRVSPLPPSSGIRQQIETRARARVDWYPLGL